MTSILDRPPPAQAGPELRVLTLWEEFLAWFWLHTGRWPKSVRFTLTQRLQNLALEVQHDLVRARYRRRGRPAILEEVNLRLEQMRYLCLQSGRDSATSPTVQAISSVSPQRGCAEIHREHVDRWRPGNRASPCVLPPARDTESGSWPVVVLEEATESFVDDDHVATIDLCTTVDHHVADALVWTLSLIMVGELGDGAAQ